MSASILFVIGWLRNSVQLEGNWVGSCSEGFCRNRLVAGVAKICGMAESRW